MIHSLKYTCSGSPVYLPLQAVADQSNRWRIVTSMIRNYGAGDCACILSLASLSKRALLTEPVSRDCPLPWLYSIAGGAAASQGH